MSELTTGVLTAAEPGTYEHLIGSRVVVEPGAYDDKDFAVLAEEVENLADAVGELVKVAGSQHNLIGILIDATGLQPVAAEAGVLGKLIPIISHMAERISDLEIRVDEADVPTANTDDYPPTEPGNALRTYFDGYSSAEVDAYRETL